MAKMIKPDELEYWNGRCVDVRNPDEFLSERLGRAELVPLGQLASMVAAWDRHQPILLICRGGTRAAQAAQQLETLGFDDLAILEGGMEACKRAGVSIVRESKTIPMFRQVLIGAGLFLLGTLVLSLMQPWFILATWLIAGMLVVAGVTGFCPMQKILQQMPWNKSDPKAACACKTN